MAERGGPFISIIVPVYNVEKYLCACIDSIICQSFEDYELILVDDGSSDACPVICDKYAASDGRIKVIHKENGGLSDARNHGIFAASGKYLLFIDSDDYIADGSLEKIFFQTKAEGECDVVFLNAVGVLSNGSFTEFAYAYTKDLIYKKSQTEVLEYFVSISQFPVSACIKFVKRQFIIENEILFTKKLVCEDLDHMIKLILTAKTYNCYDFPYYYYRCFREGSISGSRYDKLFFSLLSIIIKWNNLSKTTYSTYAPIINKILAYEYCPLLWYYHRISKHDKAVYRKKVKKYASVMSLSNDKRVILTDIFYKLFGLRVVSGLLNFYYVSKFKLKR